MGSTRWSTVGASLSCLLLAVAAGCGPSLPDAYGIYANTKCGRLQLKGQKVLVRGNMFSPVHGLKGPSGAECDSADDFIVYLKSVPPDAIALSRLEFKTDAVLTGPFGSSHESVNLWIPKDQVEIGIKPVDKHPDMYRVVPKQPLAKGFYALFLGHFGTDMPLEGGEVFDLAVGAAKDFPSYEEVARKREQSIQEAAADLLGRINQMFNSRRFEQLGQVYRPGGRALEGEGLHEFVKGNETWFQSAGKVVRSEITGTVVSDGGATARCTVATQYEKAGSQSESLVVSKIGDQFFITEMK